MSNRGVAAAPSTHSYDRPVHSGRIVTGALVISALLLLPQFHAPAPVEAACGTGWTSKLVPPKTIKVLRTATGEVQTVSFRRYVAVVMASGEWPTRLRPATLEAGATATKQYAWFHALKDHHRPGYRTSSGTCYDVVDDTRDQLYRPEQAEPTKKQQAAIDKTWIALRKKGRFFLTGYRAGFIRKCAADANGWKLYALSVEACARKGWSSSRIQHAYYDPGLTIVRAKYVLGPLLRKPTVKLRTGGRLSADPARISWTKYSSREGIDHYVVQRRKGSGPWRNVTLSDQKATSVLVGLKAGRTHQFRVHAVDVEGERGRWAIGRKVRVRLRGPKDATLSDAGAETSQGLRGRARLKATFRSIAYVAPRGPNMGKAVIKVDGKRVKTVDLRAAQRVDGKLVWTRNWKKARERVVVVRPARGDVRVDIDGFLVVR